jgi:hypothetical protein
MSVPSTSDYVRQVLTSAPGTWFCLACLPNVIRRVGGAAEDPVSIAAAIVALRAKAGFESQKGICQCGRDGYSRIRSTGNR